MTLVVGFRYPQIIEDMNISEYWGEREIEVSKNTKAIIMVSDSRVTSLTGEYKDIAQKISQLSLDLVMAYAGDVELAEGVYKSIHFRLNQKKKYYYGINEFLSIFRETILFKKEIFEKKRNQKIYADFLLSSVDDDNMPSLYSFLNNNEHMPCKLENEDYFECIGQNYSDQDALIVAIKRSVLNMASVQEQLKSKLLIDLSILDLSIGIRNGFRDFINSTAFNPGRVTVGGPLPAVSIESHPECVSMLNEWVFNPNTNESTTMIFNEKKNCWEEKSEAEIRELHTNPTKVFYRT